MADIIHLKDWRKGPEEPKDSMWRFTLNVHDGPQGFITDVFDDGQEKGERLREFAKMLDTLSYWMKQQAEDISPSDDGSCLAQVHVYENSRVVVRMNDDRIVTDEQREWLAERFEDAKDLAAGTKRNVAQ